MQASKSFSQLIHTLRGVLLIGSVLGVMAAMAASKPEDPTPSCLSGGFASPAKIKLGSSGFQDETITVVEGDLGPELRIGATRIFLDPASADRKDSPATEKSSTRWCFVDPKLSKKVHKHDRDHNQPFCNLPRAASGQDKGESLPILGLNGGEIGQLHAVEGDYDGKKVTRLFLKTKGSGNAGENVINELNILGQVVQDGDKIQSKIRVESRKVSDAVRANGRLDASVTGKIAESKNNDPLGGYKLTGCNSGNQGSGQLRKKEDEVPRGWVDLSGSQITLRGNERYGVGVFNPEEGARYMQDNDGRTGVN